MKPDEHDLLISKYLDNNLDAAELEWFDQLIQHDEAFARKLLDATLQHARMFKLAKTYQLVKDETRAEQSERSSTSKVMPIVSRSKRIKTGRLATAKNRPAAADESPEPAPVALLEHGFLWYASRFGAVAAVLLLGLWVMSRPHAAPHDTMSTETAHYALSGETTPHANAAKLTDLPANVTQSVAEIKAVSGLVVVTRGGKEQALKAGDEIRAQDVLRVQDGTAAFTYADGTHIELSRDAQMTFESDPKSPLQKKMNLREGALTADVTPQPPGQPLLIHTPYADAKVIGTILRVWVDHGQTRLATLKGKVQFTRSMDQSSVLVEAGQIAQAVQGEALTKYEFNARPTPENGEPREKGLASLEEGLVAHFSFDEGVGSLTKDSARVQPDAHIYGPQWVPGVRGTGLEFHGVGDYADFGKFGPDDNFIYRNGDAFTYAGWFKTRQDGGILISQRDANPKIIDGPVIDIGVGHVNSYLEAPGHLEALIRDDRQPMPEHIDLHGPVVNDGRWHHFALVRHGDGVCELFCDGARQARNESRAAYAVTTSVRHFGCERKWVQVLNSFEPLRWYCGALDEIRIYRRALSPGEVLALASLADSP